MKKIITKFKFNVLIIVFSVLVIGCQKEEEPITTQVTLLEQMQQTFNPNDFNETISYDYEVDWNSSTTKQYSKELESSFYEFPLNYISPLNPEALNKQREEGYYIHYKLIATIDDNDAFKFYMAKFYQEIDDNTRNSSYSISINIDNGYKGVTHMFDIENDMVFAKRIEEDRIKNNPILLKKEFSDNDMASRVIEDCQTVTTHHYKDWYKQYTVDGVTYTIYTSTQYLGSTTEEECESYWLPDLNVSGGGGHGTYIKVDPNDDVYQNCSGPKCKYDIEDESIDWPLDLEILDNIQAPQINDITDYLKCFDTTQNATITIYADQPNPGTNETWVDLDPGIGTDIDVGHTFISITQNGVTRVFGFYPKDGIKPKINESGPGLLIDDSAHPFDVSYSKFISGQQISTVISNASSSFTDYDLSAKNCTDYARIIFNSVGGNLPDTYGSWPGGGGTNPGCMGEDLRSMPNSNTTGGYAPSNSGSCN